MSLPGRPLTWARASLVANIVIVVTGGLVRLTDSGLGCPRWPKCDDQSWTTHQALGIHGVIEFSNRLLTYVLIAVAVGTVISMCANPRRTTRTIVLSIVLAVGIPFQGVIGGITVLTHLNPWVVSLHLVLSMALIAGCAVLADWVRADPRPAISGWRSWLARIAAILVAAVVYLGTMVTGSGPHAGDAIAHRNGLDPYVMSQLHAAVVYALIAISVVAAVALRRTAAHGVAWLLLAIEAVQAGIGIAQYELGLPVALVAAHLLGAGLLVAAAATLVVRTRESSEVSPAPRG